MVMSREVFWQLCQNPETYGAKSYCRRQCGMDFDRYTVDVVHSVSATNRRQRERIFGELFIMYTQLLEELLL